MINECSANEWYFNNINGICITRRKIAQKHILRFKGIVKRQVKKENHKKINPELHLTTILAVPRLTYNILNVCASISYKCNTGRQTQATKQGYRYVFIFSFKKKTYNRAINKNKVLNESFIDLKWLTVSLQSLFNVCCHFQEHLLKNVRFPFFPPTFPRSLFTVDYLGKRITVSS